MMKDVVVSNGGWTLLISLIVLASLMISVEGLAVSNRRSKLEKSTITNAAISEKTRKQSPLEKALSEYASTGKATVLIVDSNNVRGKDDFATWNSDLLPRLTNLRRQYKDGFQILYAMDHGCQPQVFKYRNDGLIVFAGPHRTADDVIAQACRFFGDGNEDGCQVIAVTSDGELKQRCLRRGGRYKRQKDKSLPIKVVGSPSLVSAVKECVGDEEESSSKNDPLSYFLTELQQVESDIRWCTALHPPFKSGTEKTEAQRYGPWTSDLMDTKRMHEIFPRKAFSELTWHRVLVAEAMRQLLELEEQGGSISSSALSQNHGKLSGYAEFFMNHQKDNASGVPIDTMFLDHRIRRETYLQEQLLNYFQKTLGSSSVSNQDMPNVPQVKSPSDLAVEFLVALVHESSDKTRDQILLRYMKEAPSHLQSSRKQDLLDLLQCVAVREKRDADLKPRWYGREKVDLESIAFHPRQGRRREQRRQRSLQAAVEDDDDVVEHNSDIEESLMQAGKILEGEWIRQWKLRVQESQ